MTTIFTFHAKLCVSAISDMKSSSQQYYLGRHPEATHVVQSPHGICYAICGSKEQAEQAMAKLREVTTP